MRRLMLSVLSPPAAVMAAVAAAALGAGIVQTGGVTVYAGAIGFKLERINPAAQCQESVFAARRGAAGQVAHPGSAFWRSLPCSASPAS